VNRVWVDRDGFRIHCTVVGKGPTVVLQSGGAGDGRMWREHLPHLTGFRAVLVDHRGRGRSDRADTVAGHAMDEYVADLVAVVSALEVSMVGFVGYSMGAQVGHALAAAHPERVGSLVGLGVGWTESDPGEDAALVRLLRAEGMPAVVSAIEAVERITLPPWLLRQFLETDAEQFALSLEALDGWRPDPADVSCPTLLVAGTGEDPTGVNERAAAAMPRGRATYLDGCGHVGAFLASGRQCELFVPHLRETVAAR
jgi:pimeloyl-ACP methyl ester carboxylesterase